MSSFYRELTIRVDTTLIDNLHLVNQIYRTFNMADFKFSIEERTFLVERLLGNNKRYTEAIKNEFAIRFPASKIPNRKRAHMFLCRFLDTGTVEDYHRSGRRLKVTLIKR